MQKTTYTWKGLGMQKLLKLKQVAEIFDVHPNTIINWVREGNFPEPVKIGSTNRWRFEELQRFIDKD